MILVVGCGNPLRGDDAAGVLTVRALPPQLPENVLAVEAGLDVSSLLDHWAEHERIVLVDAVVTGAPPGTVHRWTRPNIHPCQTPASTHGFSALDLIRLAEVLYGAHTDVRVIGIEASAFEFDAPVSPAVAAAIPSAVAAVLDELR